MKHAFVFASALLVLSGASASAAETRLLRDPAVSENHLAFVYAGDLWVSRHDGSDPRRLTSHPASETLPAFSPDGTQLAFMADYDGNSDVYVIAVDGGQPRRLTWHPGDDRPTGFSADGTQVTFVSSRERDHGRSGQLYHVSLDGGLPVKQMEARLVQGVYDEQGARLAFIPFSSGYNGLFGGTAGWKGYRGGTTPAIHVMDIEAETVTVVPGENATNFDPLWLDGQLYFLSDRDEAQFNVFRFDPASGAVSPVSRETTWDVRALGGHGSTIVYEAGGRLVSLDVNSGATREIVVDINPDLPQLLPQWKSAAGTVQAAGLSPSGKRAIVTARGDVFTVPTDEGSTRNITGSGGVREYAGTWSPDGESVAYIVESLSGQSLVIEPQTGMGSRQSFTLGPHYYDLLAWSDAGNGYIVFEDNHLVLHAIDLANGRISTIARGARREAVEVALSPDGRWLAFTHEGLNFNRDLVLHNLATGAQHTVTDGAADIASPAFSRDGQYLYFAASTNSGPLQVGLNMTSQERPYRAGLYALVLAADGASPLLPGSGDEEAGSDGDDGTDDDESDGETDVSVRIDIDGLGDRVVALPVAERNYENLAVADGGALYYVRAVQAGASNTPPGEDERSENVLMRFDFEEREASDVLDGIGSFVLSADGKKLLLTKVDNSLLVADVGDDIEPEALDLGGLRMRVDPREEWALIFDEVWRMEKEYFYDPDLHGLDWQAVYERFRPLLPHVGRREDLNELLVEMIAEMRAGHNRVGGGDVYRGSGEAAGLLGANLEIDNGRYRIIRVYDGETWNPFIAAPLATPGNAAREGDYILAINGEDLSGSDNIWARLQGTVGKQVSLRVGPRADGRDARDIVVEPVASERELRLWRWVEDNRRAVSEASDGRVGYVYLPNTAGAGFTFFNRMFFAQLDKDALIIDERSNGGGQAANYITDVLSRRHLSGWKDRDGAVFNTPAGAMHGPKVMLIDQDAGSGGDFLPYSFRKLGIGKLIGTRTWGGLIGIYTNPELVDGGVVAVPYFRFYDTDHAWSVENEGVAPDIEVALDPLATNEGRDTQLERAIAEVLQQLESFKDPVPDEAPPYPTELGE